MQVTVEISLYPLTENFEQVVIEYIQKLKSYSNIKVEVNGLSTQVFGDYDEVMQALAHLNKFTLDTYRSVVLMKMAAGEKSTGNLPEVLK